MSLFQCSRILAVGVEVVSTCTGNICVYCKHYYCNSHHFIKFLPSLFCYVYVTYIAWDFTDLSSKTNRDGYILKSLHTSKTYSYIESLSYVKFSDNNKI
jgi:hypothetical protein